MSPRPRWLSGLTGLIVLFLAVACQQPPSPANELVGVWSLTAVDPGDGSPVIEPSQPGLYIFADGYYSAVYAPGTDPRINSGISFQPTPEEMVTQYETIIVNTGTYAISGSTVTFFPVIAKSPAFVGGHQMSTFRVEGNTLTLSQDMLMSVDGASPTDFSGSLTLVRVE